MTKSPSLHSLGTRFDTMYIGAGCLLLREVAKKLLLSMIPDSEPDMALSIRQECVLKQDEACTQVGAKPLYYILVLTEHAFVWICLVSTCKSRLLSTKTILVGKAYCMTLAAATRETSMSPSHTVNFVLLFEVDYCSTSWLSWIRSTAWHCTPQFMNHVVVTHEIE
jgi:hypothetical protein